MCDRTCCTAALLSWTTAKMRTQLSGRQAGAASTHFVKAPGASGRLGGYAVKRKSQETSRGPSVSPGDPGLAPPHLRVSILNL